MLLSWLQSNELAYFMVNAIHHSITVFHKVCLNGTTYEISLDYHNSDTFTTVVAIVRILKIYTWKENSRHVPNARWNWNPVESDWVKYKYALQIIEWALRWRRNGRDSVSNHQPHDCLLNRLFRRRSKRTSKLRVTGLCAGNSPGTGAFPAQMSSNAENVSIWWRHHRKGSVDDAGWKRENVMSQIAIRNNSSISPPVAHSARVRKTWAILYKHDTKITKIV